ncbi:pilus assembly protein [Intrasporangium chromatireducens Q5-1]|uniref:Pilus assembly protein n=1 Tax=Intrasporangium chromatireducens Q5-1 TaxID=584657 RepID=W9GRX0_9MICO|nr:pilus assembly protein [Intrasporangium chromatireducens Q5-1]
MDGSGWVVFGAGGHARAVVDVLERLGETVAAVVGDAQGSTWHVEVIADDTAGLALVTDQRLRAAVAIGAAGPRLRTLGQLRETAGRGGGAGRPIEEVAPAVVATSATVARTAVLGAGTIVLEHAHVGPASRVGDGVIVNTGAIVEHDCTLGDGVHVAPGAALLGGASVGPRTLVGSGARVLPRVTVGSDVTVGAGAVVVRSVEDGLVVLGVPATSAAAATGGAS